MVSKPSRVSLTEEAAGGLLAGIVGTVIGFPLDLIKTRMQTHQGQPGGGIFENGLRVVKSEGILALYKGIAPPLISLSILNTFTFASYSYFQTIFQADRGWDWRNSVAGGVCGPFAATVSTVENLVKTQMQVDNISKKQFIGSWDCVTKLTRTHGPLILYTGFGINSIREIAFLTTYFGLYEGLRQTFGDLAGRHPISTWTIPVAGGFAGAASWFLSFPLDCIRAGVQGQDMSSQRKGSLKVLWYLMETKGVKGVYGGVSPSIVRAFLVSGSRFSAYEGALWLLRGGRDVQH
jgi:solute carrier family 25 carnitine/acylcarnitine transporter 20/29